MTRSPATSDDGILELLPAATDQDRDALWRARAPRRLSPVELAAWLAATCPKDGAALRARPHTIGEPFTL